MENEIEKEVEESAEDVEEVEPAAEETEEAEEVEESAEDDEAFDVDALEYDENGDIKIPEDVEDEDSSANDGEESSIDEGEEEKAPEKVSDERDARIASLEEQLAALTSQSKDTLKKLGIEKDDVMEGLADLAAESADMTTEEYLAERQKVTEAEKAARKKAAEDFEALAAADLTVLKQNFPETKGYKHIKDMPAEVLKKFADYRNKGVPAKEAYAAANVDGIRAGVATSAKKEAQKDSKAHLRSSQPKGGRNGGTYITNKEMNMWREMFPYKSDREIVALYKKTK